MHPPLVLEIAGIHGDETSICLLMKKVFEDSQIPRIQILYANEEVEFLHSRGSYKGPTKTNKQPDICDLNRLFHVRNKNKWRKLYHQEKHMEVKCLIKLIRDNPQLRTVFSFHEDMDFGDLDNIYDIKRQNSCEEGFYFYHITDNEVPEDKIVIGCLKQYLIGCLKKEGFVIFKGIDDPMLNNSAIQKGFIDHPTPKDDGSFENAIVEMSRYGLTNIAHAFTFEIPGKLSLERKELMLQIIKKEFIEPFIKSQGIV